VPGFGRRKRGGTSQDQVVAVDVQLEDRIRKIGGLVDGYLRSPRDEATRQALLAELEKFDDQTARADAYSNFRSVLVRYQVPRSWLIGATSDTSIGEDVPSSEFKAQVALVKAAKNAIRDTTAEVQSALRRANDELALWAIAWPAWPGWPLKIAALPRHQTSGSTRPGSAPTWTWPAGWRTWPRKSPMHSTRRALAGPRLVLDRPRPRHVRHSGGRPAALSRHRALPRCAAVPKLDLSWPTGSDAFRGPDHVDDRADFEHRAGQLQAAHVVAARAPGIRICLRECVPAEALMRPRELTALPGERALPAMGR
jgi:hypothetical protein